MFVTQPSPQGKPVAPDTVNAKTKQIFHRPLGEKNAPNPLSGREAQPRRAAPPLLPPKLAPLSRVPPVKPFNLHCTLSLSRPSAGAFLFCWTPFFVVHITRALCKSCAIPSQVTSTVTWLGYVNSALNPVIYTVFNAEFRNFFRKVLHIFC